MLAYELYVSHVAVIGNVSVLEMGCMPNTYLTSALLTPNLINLSLREALRLDRRVVAQAIPLPHFLRRYRSALLAICSLIDCNDYSTSETEIVLESSGCAFD